MVRKVIEHYGTRINNDFQQKTLEIQESQRKYDEGFSQLVLQGKIINNALLKIQNLKEEHKDPLIKAIVNLEEEIFKEEDLTLLLKKYKALSSMIDITVLRQTTLPEKANALDSFLAEFRTTSSSFKGKVKLGVSISSIVLVIAVGIAASFILPMIPFAAAFAYLGISGTALTVASISTRIVLQVGGVMAFSILLTKCNEAISQSLSSLLQSFTSECKAAKLLQYEVKRNTFFREEKEPAILSNVQYSCT